MKNDFNLNEEIRNNYKISKKMKKIWKIELDMLVELMRVCEKHSLKLYADSGTLLGAIRHKGFIPWDDDIDVVMLREDYNKLINLPQTEFNKPYFLQTAYSDIEYYRSHAQLRNSNTAAILPHEGKNVKFNQGIFIDIFPLDELSRFKFIQKRKVQKLNKKIKQMQIIINKNESKNKIKYCIKELIKKRYKNSHLKIYKKFEKISSKNLFHSDYIDAVSFLREYDKYSFMKKEWYKETIYVPFENIMIPIPKEYDNVLKAMYGKDYMIPKNIPTEHGEVLFDPDYSYKEVLEKMH